MTESLRKRLEYLMGAYGPSLARHVARGLMWQGPSHGSQKSVYLTFDDGPTPHLTPLLLDILNEMQVKATFFLLGRQVAAHPDLAREIIRRRHAVGVHGYAHLDAWATDADQIESDLRESVSTLYSVTGSQPHLYRPPYGRFTRRTRVVAAELGLRTVMWGIMPGDYLPGVTRSQLTDRVMKRLKPGAIIVLHDSANPNVRQHTAPAVREILERALTGGWKFRALGR
ncbi:MAG: polysaccharide deacetylase family protein [Rhodothermia bacterium]|nr:polysaccharide deacetylase family protein [Rhodothermia bacterium]